MTITFPMHRRHATVEHCLKKNREAGITSYVGGYTEAEDGILLLLEGVHSIKAPNIIHVKAQAAVFKAYELNPDAVVLMGSDDYFDGDTAERLNDLLKHHDYIAFGDCVFEGEAGNRRLWPGYPQIHPRKGEPAGAGKVIRRDLLDRIGWDVYGNAGGKADDRACHAVLRKYAQAMKIVTTADGFVLVDRKDSESQTPMRHFKYLKGYEV